jgi:hypothetical protein
VEDVIECVSSDGEPDEETDSDETVEVTVPGWSSVPRDLVWLLKR